MRSLRPLAAAALWAALSSCTAASSAASPEDAAAAADSASPDSSEAAPDTVTATDSEAPSADAAPDAAPAGVTWHGRTRGLVEAHCGSCHSEGGAGPFPLTTLDEVNTMAAAVRSAVDAGRMPPWRPDPSCRPMENERLLAPDERADLLAWLDGGRPAGQPSEYVPPETAPARPPYTLELRAAEAYVASRAVPDDYRCLVLDHDFDADTFITGIDVAPGHRPVVHHVLLYVAKADELAKLDALDAAEPGPGYTCYGGPRVGNGDTLGGWVPGSVGFHLPDGVALQVPKGARLIMQIHYNTTALPAGQEPPPDRSAVQLWTLPEGASPKHLARILPFAHTKIAIPAGDAHSVQTKTFSIPISGTVIGTVPHMHTLGTSLSVTLERENADDACIVNVPDWDFAWQQFYLFPPEHYVQALPGDTLRLTCTYDNSAANQPVINGVQAAPREVHWGEGTLDEMCLNYAIIRTPYFPPDGSTTCPGFSPCVKACDPGDVQCFLDCNVYAGTDCAGCVLPKVGTCAAGAGCGLEMAGLLGCLNDCEGDQFACLLNACKPALQTVYTCLEPKLLAGGCDEALSDCEVVFEK